MYFKILKLIVIVVVVNACNQQEKEAIDHFETVFEIVEYDSIYSDKNDAIIRLGAHTDIDIFENVVIAYNRSGNDSYFSFYDIVNGVLVGSWGRKGQGPGEYVQLGSGFTLFNSQLIFLDRAKREINYVPLSNILCETEILTVKREPYPYTVEFRPTHLNIIHDKKIAIGSFQTGRFGILDAENNIINCTYDYPFTFPEITDIYRGSVFQGRIKSNAKQSKFVISTFASDIFEIYQITDSGIYRTYVSPFNYIPKIVKKPRENLNYTIDYERSTAGLINLAVTNDLICFTHSAKSYAECADSNNESNEILCFDWNGEKIKKYILPIPINNFCLDENYIYGVREYNDETVIYRFKMNK